MSDLLLFLSSCWQNRIKLDFYRFVAKSSWFVVGLRLKNTKVLATHKKKKFYMHNFQIQTDVMYKNLFSEWAVYIYVINVAGAYLCRLYNL